MTRRVRPIAPQSDNFQVLFILLRSLTNQDIAGTLLPEATGVEKRQIGYGLHALRLLGLLDDNRSLTQSGIAIAEATSFDGPTWKLFAKAVQASTPIQLLAPGIGTAGFQLTREQLTGRISDLSGYSSTTSSRRAQTLLSWHRQLLRASTPAPAPAPAPEQLLLNRIGMNVNYVRKIGSGAYSEVWHATDELNRELAIKFLHEDMRGRLDLVADARALSRLNHPNVVRIVAVEELRPPIDSSLPRQPTLAVVMDYAPGVLLEAELLDARQGYTEVERIALGLISGIKALHAEGVVHQDLHSRNVIVSDRGVTIIDPYYQSSLRADSEADKQKKIDADLRALKQMLASVVTHSVLPMAIWDEVQPEFWNCESLASIEQTFLHYILRVRKLEDPRPERGESVIPLPGGMGISSYTRFIRSLGFSDDPFFHTNAANEPRLRDYFVRPKYFRSLQADKDRPSSGVVLAPRGSGKTAQALMLGEHTKTVRVFPVFHDSFDELKGSTSRTPDISFHYRHIARNATVALLLYMDVNGIPFSSLASLSSAVGSLAFRLLPQASRANLRGLEANPYLKGRLSEIWTEQVASSRQVGDFLLNRWQAAGLAPGPGSSKPVPADDFELTKLLARHLRFEGVSVIVDKVDEAAFSNNNAERTYRLVQAILSDLKLFDDPYVGWKVFLWDQCKEFLEAKGRTDRLPVYELKWTSEELRSMLSNRLMAFSSNSISGLSALAEENASYEIGQWPFVFANFSPRSLIRILQDAVREQIEIDPDARGISLMALERGIVQFSGLNAAETTENKWLRLLQRLGRASFTISDLAKHLKQSPESARPKVLAMTAAGAIRQAGTIKVNAGIKASNYYLVTQPSVVAFTCGSRGTIRDLMKTIYATCGSCHAVIFNEDEEREDDFACPECGSLEFTRG